MFRAVVHVVVLPKPAPATEDAEKSWKDEAGDREKVVRTARPLFGWPVDDRTTVSVAHGAVNLHPPVKGTICRITWTSREMRQTDEFGVASRKLLVALHEALLYLWPTSPVSFFNKGLLFFTGCDGPSFYAYTQAVKIPHNLDPSKLKLFPYFRYMYEGRRAVHRLDLDVDAELLFNNIVVHSADHYNLYQLGKDVLYPFDGTFTFASYLKSVTFQHYWTPPVNSLFQDERLRCSDVPFYKALYEELSSIDKELADNTSKSCSY